MILDPRVDSVDDLLRDYEKHPGLSVYWVTLGSSGHKVRPRGWVTGSYTKCTPDSSFYNTQFKTFANTAFKPTMYSPHRAVFATGGQDDPYMVNELFQRIARGRNKNSTHERAAVYHYATKSREEFLKKLKRGGGAGVTRPRNYLAVLDKACTRTCDGAIKTYERFCGKKLPQLLAER